MYNISETLKNAIKAQAVVMTARITVLPDNTVIDGNNLSTIKIVDKCYNEGIIIGTAMCKELEIEIINDNFDLADKEISLEVGVQLTNGTYEYMPFGNYIVKEYNDMKSNNKYKIIAYDYMDKLNAEFIDAYDYSTPITLQTFYENVASYYGIEIVSQDLPNQDFIITSKPYFDGMTGRVVLARIAEMFGSFAKFNRNNKLQMYLATETGEKLTRDDMNTSLQINSMFGPINVVAMRLSDIEGENVTLRDETSIATYGENILQISDNPFAYTQALRQVAIQEIFDRVKGFSYYPTEFNFKAIYFDCGDIVEVQDMSTDNYYPTIILNQTLQIPNTIKSKCTNSALTKTGLEYQFVSEQAIKNRRTEYLIDKQNQKIQEIIEKTTNIETNSVYKVEVLYALSSSATEAPTEGWSITAPPWTEGMYMWQKTVTIYIDGSAVESDATNISGSKGADGKDGVAGEDGRGIKSIINYYLATSLMTGVTTSTEGWTTDIQTMTPTNKYLWNYDVINYTDGTYVTGIPIVIGIYGNTGATGADGADGKSAYEIWLEAGNTGTEEDYLASLKGEKGDTGEARYKWCSR